MYARTVGFYYYYYFTNVDIANLNILKNVFIYVIDQHLTIHELSNDEIEFMTHDVATNWTLLYMCVYIQNFN